MTRHGPSSGAQREIHLYRRDQNHFDLLIPSVWYLTILSKVEIQDSLTGMGRSNISSAELESNRGKIDSCGQEFPFFKSFYDYLIRSKIILPSSKTKSQKPSDSRTQYFPLRPLVHPMTSFIRILNSGTFARKKKAAPSDMTPPLPIRNIKLGHQVSDSFDSQTLPSQITSSTSFLRMNNVLTVMTPRKLDEKLKEPSIFYPYSVEESWAIEIAKNQLAISFFMAQAHSSVTTN